MNDSLTSSQKAILALEVEKRLAEEAKERQREAARRTNAMRWGSDKTITSSTRGGDKTIGSPTGKNNEVAHQASQIVGVSHAYIAAAKKIQRSAPELLDLIRNGLITIPDAKRIAIVPEPYRAAVIQKIEIGEAKSAKEAIGQVIRKRGEKPPPENFGVGWPRAMHKLWVFFNSLRDHGGIEMLSQRWSKEVKANYLRELRQVRGRMDECIEYLEKELSK